jgi:hypothetical protein
MAAGIIKTRAIQLQFLLNQASLSVKFKIMISTMDRSPHGNIKNEEGLEAGCGDMAVNFG